MGTTRGSGRAGSGVVCNFGESSHCVVNQGSEVTQGVDVHPTVCTGAHSGQDGGLLFGCFARDVNTKFGQVGGVERRVNGQACGCVDDFLGRRKNVFDFGNAVHRIGRFGIYNSADKRG